MNEPNTQEHQPNKQRSNRATNFLKSRLNSGTAGQVSQTQPIQDPHAAEGANSQYAESGDAHSEISEAQPKKTTGVISSTIYPKDRPGVTPPPESAAKTSQLAPTPKKPVISEAEKARLKEEKMDNLAEKITNVLEKLNDFKTGMLDRNMDTAEKMKFMADKYPGISGFLGFLITRLQPMILFMQKFNQKMVEKNLKQPVPTKYQPEPMDEDDLPPPPPEKISFLELAEKNIIFCDNRKRPLYTQEKMIGKHGYTASEEVLAPMIFEEIMRAFQEVAPKAKAIPTPTSGMFAGTPMDQVMENINEEHILMFLNYVKKFPRGYVGKNFRITESFAGWVVSGTPDD